MKPLLFSMLLACNEQPEDSGHTSGETEDPKWFEAGTYSCVSDFCPGDPTLTFTQTGSISNYEYSWVDDESGNVRTVSGKCLVGEAITPDETMWGVICDDEHLSFLKRNELRFLNVFGEYLST